jgi:hypothetical protein
MALDTAQKRMMVPGVGRPWMRAVFPVATPTEAWRLNVGNTYGGNALSGAGPADEQDGKMVTPAQHFTRPAEVLG